MDIKQIKKIARNEAHKVSAIHILILIGIALVAGMMANATTITSNRITNVTGIPTDVTYLATITNDNVNSPSCGYTNLDYITDGNPLTSATFNSSCNVIYVNFSKRVSITGIAYNVTNNGGTLTLNQLGTPSDIMFSFGNFNIVNNNVYYSPIIAGANGYPYASKNYSLNNIFVWNNINELEFYGIEFDNTI